MSEWVLCLVRRGEAYTCHLKDKWAGPKRGLERNFSTIGLRREGDWMARIWSRIWARFYFEEV